MEYIYKVLINKSNNQKKEELYFIGAAETHQYLDLPYVKVYYLKVSIHSFEFNCAVFNNKIKIDPDSTNDNIRYLHTY